MRERTTQRRLSSGGSAAPKRPVSKAERPARAPKRKAVAEAGAEEAAGAAWDAASPTASPAAVASAALSPESLAAGMAGPPEASGEVESSVEGRPATPEEVGADGAVGVLADDEAEGAGVTDPSGDEAADDELDESEGAPEEVAAEEARVRAQRERAAAAASAGAAPAEKLADPRFRQLEELLNRSELYTRFLVEQMNSADDQIDKDVAEEEARRAKEAEAGTKARAKAGAKGGTKGAGSKRGKAEAGTAPEGAAAAGHDAEASGRSVTRSLCPGLACELREYQVRGVRWMISLYQNGINGILADQMGLGKTVQSIGFLCHLRSKGVVSPYLVLGPLSTLTNWVSEFQRWAPDVPVLLYHGSKAQRQALAAEHLSGPPSARTPVIVTSYEIAIADSRVLQRFVWKYVIVDEGHRLKNSNCRLLRELRQLRADNKLLLTGTPLQNNLGELWSLLNFILPQVFSSLSDFEAWFESVDARDATTPVGPADETADEAAARRFAEQRQLVAAKLHAVLKPFLLRRVKSDVETALPGKLEIILYASMRDRQRDLDSALREAVLKRREEWRGKTMGVEKKLKVASERAGGGVGDAGTLEPEIADGEPRDGAPICSPTAAEDASPAKGGAAEAAGGSDDEIPVADARSAKRAAAAAAGAVGAGSKTRAGRAAAAARGEGRGGDEGALAATGGAGDRVGGASLSQLRNTLMQLRKNCNHPDLVDGSSDGSVFYPPSSELLRDCGKLALLDRLLDRLLSDPSRKVLIFSQMTTMLDVLDHYLAEKGVGSARLDGSVSWQDRQEAISKFRSDPGCRVFLLSTRAGGLGINLTAADTVIIYDSDWNPHQDLQAMDRCHRIGQTNPVLVFRLATARSVEGGILERANAKLDLERLVIKKGAFLHEDAGGAGPAASLSREELVKMLSASGAASGLPQSRDVSDRTLDLLLDRTHLVKDEPRPYPDQGAGYEVVHQISGQGMLAGVE